MGNAMWTREDGAALVERLGAAVAPHGCRLVMVGSVASRGFSTHDLDISLAFDGNDDTPQRLLGAIDAIRDHGFLLIAFLDRRVAFLDPAFRPIEIWLDNALPEHLAGVMKSRLLADKKDAPKRVERARERGRPPGFEHVPLAVFERRREALAVLTVAADLNNFLETRRPEDGRRLVSALRRIMRRPDLADEIEAMLPPASLCANEDEGGVLVGDGASWALAIDEMVSRMGEH